MIRQMALAEYLNKKYSLQLQLKLLGISFERIWAKAGSRLGPADH
jgi:hypothetical protein